MTTVTQPPTTARSRSEGRRRRWGIPKLPNRPATVGDRLHREIVCGGDAFDPHSLGDLGTAVADAEVVDCDEDDAPCDMMLGLRVSAMSWEMHVVIAARISTAEQREHYGLTLDELVRHRHKHRRDDGQRPG